jgi:membrane protein DedA with SNARE-associated domain
LIESAIAFLASLVWVATTQWIGYFTGRAAIQALSLGRLDVADFGYHNQKSAKPLWYHGKQPVVSFWIAIAVGQFLWLGAFIGAIVFLVGS